MILLSVFRNSGNYVDRYIEQVKCLRNLVGDVHVVAVEGDSTDYTYERLLATDFKVLKVEHGGPMFESMDRALRWRQLGAVCNVGMVAAVRDLTEGEPLVYMESDLIWSPEIVERLVHHTETFPAVAPLSIQGARFYDVWGYSKDGTRFGPWPPYHPGVNLERMVTIDTAGSCIAMSYAAAQVAEFSLTDCIKGIGRSLYANGHSLWLDPTLRVTHP